MGWSCIQRNNPKILFRIICWNCSKDVKNYEKLPLRELTSYITQKRCANHYTNHCIPKWSRSHIQASVSQNLVRFGRKCLVWLNFSKFFCNNVFWNVKLYEISINYNKVTFHILQYIPHIHLCIMFYIKKTFYIAGEATRSAGLRQRFRQEEINMVDWIM